MLLVYGWMCHVISVAFPIDHLRTLKCVLFSLLIQDIRRRQSTQWKQFPGLKSFAETKIATTMPPSLTQKHRFESREYAPPPCNSSDHRQGPIDIRVQNQLSNDESADHRSLSTHGSASIDTPRSTSILENPGHDGPRKVRDGPFNLTSTDTIQCSPHLPSLANWAGE